MKLLLLGPDCLIVRCLIQRAHARRLRFDWLTPSVLIKRLRVDDVIRADGPVTVKWNVHPSSLNNRSITGTFNCLGTAPFRGLLHHASEAQQYALQELTSYVAFALSRFRNVINEPAAGGLSGTSESLPYQWKSALAITGKIDVPWHEITSRPVRVARQIQTRNFFDCSNWDPSAPSPRKGLGALVLSYQRPLGAPIICWFIDSQLMLFKAHGDAGTSLAIGRTACETIREVTMGLANEFRLRLGQAVYFVDGSHVVFGSIMPYLSYELARLGTQLRMTDRILSALG